MMLVYINMSTFGRIQGFPVVKPRIERQTFLGTDVEGAGVSFKHIRGNIIFEVEDVTTNFIWSFQIEGAPGSVSRYNAVNYVLYTNTLNGIASYTKNAENDYTFVTDVADSGGRTYRIVFQPYVDYPTLVNKTAGAAIATDVELRANAQLCF